MKKPATVVEEGDGSMTDLEKKFREVLGRDSISAELLMSRLSRHLGVPLARTPDLDRLTDEQQKRGIAYLSGSNYNATIDVDRLARLV